MIYLDDILQKNKDIHKLIKMFHRYSGVVRSEQILKHVLKKSFLNVQTIGN